MASFIPPLKNPDHLHLSESPNSSPLKKHRQGSPKLNGPTITFLGNEYNILSQCTDKVLIQKLIDQSLLPINISLPAYFSKLKCREESYVVNKINEIQGGGSNVVFALDGTKVIRIGIKKYEEPPFGQLKGFIIQAYLSQFCKNICKVYDFGTIDYEDGYGVYAVLERLGPDFMTEYENNKRYSIDTIIRYIQEILDALMCIHGKGYIHCDIKLENMAIRMLEPRVVCLFDFDDAIYLPDGTNMYVQKPPKGIGTPLYWAPEVCLPHVDENKKYIECNPTRPIIKHTIYTDIYACGICLKNFLTYLLLDQNTDNTKVEYMYQLVVFMCASVFIKAVGEDRTVQELQDVNIPFPDEEPLSDEKPSRFYYFVFLDIGRFNASKALEYIQQIKIAKQESHNSNDHSHKKQRSNGGKIRQKDNMDKLHVPKRYIPATLTRRDLAKQRQYLRKSRKMYKKHKYYQRPKVASFHSRKSRHLAHAERMYGVDHVAPTAELAKKTRCSVKALEKIVNKGRGAYYSSGSRPNQTAESWGIARLASAITGGNASVIDLHILEKGCKPDSQALALAKAKTNANT